MGLSCQVVVFGFLLVLCSELESRSSFFNVRGARMRPGSIEYDPVLGTEMLHRSADGESLASICRDEGMPDERSVRRWARKHGEFGDQYAIARRLGYEKRADELLEIADDASADWIETENGHRILDNVRVNRARLMIDTRKWLLSMVLPKVYGDHVTVAGDPDQPIHVVRRIDWASLSDGELEAIETFALAAQRRLRAAQGTEAELTVDNHALLIER
jgi:hypothetical protein